MAQVGSKRLGRGLSDLLKAPMAETKPEAQGDYAPEYPMENLRPNPEQPRRHFDDEALKELASSIKAHGLLQPILARRLNYGAIIVAGERRYRAAKLAGLLTVPVRFVEADDRRTREMALVENLQREDLKPLELASALRELTEKFGLTQDELSKRLGWSRSAVSNKMRLLSLPQPVADALAGEAITEGHARALLGLESEEAIKRVLSECVRLNWSVRQVENRVRRLCLQQGMPPQRKARCWRPRSAARLARDLGVKCSISGLDEDNSFTLSGLTRLQVKIVCALLEANVDRIKDSAAQKDLAAVQDKSADGE